MVPLLLLARLEAQDGRWLLAAQTTDSVTYIDSASVKIAGRDIIELRIKQQYARIQERNRVSRYDYSRYDMEITRERIHCTHLRSMYLESATYLHGERVQRSQGSARAHSWGQPLADAKLRLAELACSMAFDKPLAPKP